MKEYLPNGSVSHLSNPPYFFEIDLSNKQYFITASHYVSNIMEDTLISKKSIVSKGNVEIKADTVICFEDDTNKIMLFRQLDEYQLIVIACNGYYNKEEVLYINSIVEGSTKWIFNWKGGILYSQFIHNNEGITSIFYDKGVVKDSTFITWEKAFNHMIIE
ncbi:hypothetical protein AGMMS50262_23070 [Bacteroidia bacterium]|nr:hypothetical protein AGMMS50262_23070 [Bacteroidia bacterium]